MNILEELKATGAPLSNWCSDVYVEVNDQTKAIVKDYEYKCNVTMFTDEISGNLSYEIPFIYDYKTFGNLQ